MHIATTSPFSEGISSSVTVETALRLSESGIKETIFNRIKSGEANKLNEYLTSFDALQKTQYLSSCMQFETQWSRAEENMTPLQYACFLGNIDVVRVLLEHGASGNDFGDTSNSTQRGSIHFALDANQAEIALLLLKQGAQDEAASCHQFHGLREYQLPKEWGSGSWTCLSALHMAIIKNMEEVVEELLITGAAKISEKASGNHSCLHLAARNGNKKIIKQLLFYGANTLLRSKDQSGSAPQDVARANGHHDLLELLSI